jgi:uncharacterized membrane-anchored protein
MWTSPFSKFQLTIGEILMTKKIILLIVSLLIGGTALAQSPAPDGKTTTNAATDTGGKKAMTAAEFEASLKYQQGEITLPNKVATLNIPKEFRYLGPADAEKVLVAWGNPPGHQALGMIFPAEVGPLSDNGWGIVITYEEEGYVSDSDADSIKYDDLLKQMKEDIAASNEKRKKQGYGTLELIGWAAKPYYDKQTHKLHWAKELSFNNNPTHTLNYNIRILGRYGVLILNAVAGVNQLTSVEKNMQQVLALTNFNPGYRYEDFNSSTDKVAAYGLAALVAGGIAAKAGLFSKLLVLLIAAKKFIILIVVVVVAFIGKLFKRKKAES